MPGLLTFAIVTASDKGWQGTGIVQEDRYEQHFQHFLIARREALACPNGQGISHDDSAANGRSPKSIAAEV
jgi:hypothetical protein